MLYLLVKYFQEAIMLFCQSSLISQNVCVSNGLDYF